MSGELEIVEIGPEMAKFCRKQVWPSSFPDSTHFRSRDVIHFVFFRLLVLGFLTESVVRLAIACTVWPRLIGGGPLYHTASLAEND
mgnify:CR=1 FL=1